MNIIENWEKNVIVEVLTNYDNQGPEIETLSEFPNNGGGLSGPQYVTKRLVRCLRSVGIDAYIKWFENHEGEVPYYKESKNPDFYIAIRTPELITDENYIFYCRDRPHRTFPKYPKNFVFVSDYVKEFWKHDPMAYDGPVMYSPLDLEYFSPGLKHPNLICASSVINEIKNLDVMCDVVDKVKSKNPDVVFNFFGCMEMWGHSEMEKRSSIKTYERLLSSADYVGWIPQEKLKEHLKYSTYFLHLSKTETWGCAVQEAVSAGCIAITSDIPAMKEIVDHDYKYISNDVESFVSVIDFLYQPEQLNKRLHLMSEARKWSESLWSYEVMGNRWKRYLESV